MRKEPSSKTSADGLASDDREAGDAVRTLDRIADVAPHTAGVWVRDVRPGDWLVVRTRNSTYAAAVVEAGTYHVAGGWFSATGNDNVPVGINGCTWGGTAIHTDLVAAPGMFLEFSNGVRTTRIQDVRLFRGGAGREH